MAEHPQPPRRPRASALRTAALGGRARLAAALVLALFSGGAAGLGPGAAPAAAPSFAEAAPEPALAPAAPAPTAATYAPAPAAAVAAPAVTAPAPSAVDAEALASLAAFSPASAPQPAASAPQAAAAAPQAPAPLPQPTPAPAAPAAVVTQPLPTPPPAAFSLFRWAGFTPQPPPSSGTARSSAAYVKKYTRSYDDAPAGPDPTALSLNLLQLYTLEAIDELAVCNDGSPGGYYFSASATGSPLWVVYLQGGMWCWDQASCDARASDAAFEMSSTHWPKVQTVGGVFSKSPLNPWADANKVYLSYCSSDAWIGDAAASPATFNYAFRGQRIIEATLADLALNRGLDGSAQVLFGGCSAGARGAMFNLDYVQAYLPAGATVRGLLDSALWLDLSPPDTQEVTLQAQTQGVFGLVNPGARIPAACAAAYPGSEGWKCLLGVYRLPFVTTDYFINAAQFDSFQMLYDLGGNPPEAPLQVQFADTFQQATVSALQPAVQAGMAVFSASCLVHCLTADTAYYTSYTAQNVTIAEALQHWYFEGGTPVLVSGCQGYPCAKQCPGGSTIAYMSEATKSQDELDTAKGSAAAALFSGGAGTEVDGVWVAFMPPLPPKRMDLPPMPPAPAQTASDVDAGNSNWNSWSSRQNQMGFGTMPATGAAAAAMPGGQGFAPAGAVANGATAATETPVAAQGWMMLGRRMAMR